MLVRTPRAAGHDIPDTIAAGLASLLLMDPRRCVVAPPAPLLADFLCRHPEKDAVVVSGAIGVVHVIADRSGFQRRRQKFASTFASAAAGATFHPEHGRCFSATAPRLPCRRSGDTVLRPGQLPTGVFIASRDKARTSR